MSRACSVEVVESGARKGTAGAAAEVVAWPLSAEGSALRFDALQAERAA